MEQRIKRDSALENLVSEFEANFENGKIEYLQEKSFFQLLRYYEEVKEYEKAIDVAKLASDQYKYRSDFYITLSRLLLKINAFKDCLHYLRLAESIAPYESEIIILKVKALAKSGNYKKAFKELGSLKALSLSGDMVEINLCEADIFHEMGKYEQMYYSVKEALHIDPLHEEALEKYWTATELSRKYIDCEDFMMSLINENPYNYLAWYNYAQALSFKGDYKDAIAAMEYSFIINPDFISGYMDCADLCYQMKNFEDALKIYKEVVDVLQDDIDLLVKVAECQLYLNKVVESKDILYRAILLDPYNEEAYYFLGECYSKEENWYKAINAYHKAIDIEENCDEYYLGLARAYTAVEDYNKATVNYNLAISEGPEQTYFWMEFSSFLLKLGLYEESLKVLDEAEEHTFGADLLYCRALTNFFLGNKKEGLENLEEALVEDYSLHTIIYSLAPEFEVDKEIKSMISYFAGE